MTQTDIAPSWISAAAMAPAVMEARNGMSMGTPWWLGERDEEKRPGIAPRALRGGVDLHKHLPSLLRSAKDSLRSNVMEMPFGGSHQLIMTAQALICHYCIGSDRLSLKSPTPHQNPIRFFL